LKLVVESQLAAQFYKARCASWACSICEVGSHKLRCRFFEVMLRCAAACCLKTKCKKTGKVSKRYAAMRSCVLPPQKKKTEKVSSKVSSRSFKNHAVIRSCVLPATTKKSAKLQHMS
jgi:hypothetical protein